MYGANTGSTALKAVVNSPSYLSQEFNEYIPFVDLSATIADDGKPLYLHAVNRHESEMADLRVSFRGFKPRKASQLYVAGRSVDDRNMLDEPDNVGIEEASPKVDKCEVVLALKPHSVNTITVG